MRDSILISNIWLKNFGGSELVSVELAEIYSKSNWNVVLYSPEIGSPLVDNINKRINLEITNKLPSNLDQFNIIWSHHGLLLDKINTTNKKENQIIISNHMSSYVDLEKPKYNPSHVDIILANSEETKASFPHVEYKIKTKLFQNPAPPVKTRTKNDSFSVFGETAKKRPKVAAISNHRPLDLESFLNRNNENLLVYKYGARDVLRRISPDFLIENGFDFVICNGKSVQYALEAQIPVFLYDQFGGCGWLNKDNFERAAWYNFSGRGFEKFAELESMRIIPRPMSADFANWRFQLETWLIRMQLI